MILLFLWIAVALANEECPGEDLSLAPRPLIGKKNSTECEFPYKNPNCTCPSSMFECACHKYDKCGDKPGCIEMSKVNDWWENDCGDWSDEMGPMDSCPLGTFQCDCFNTTCKGFIGCLESDWKCNGNTECLDGSDEVNCTCLANEFECPCRKNKTCLLITGCVSKEKQCDGFNDCEDWGDEANCTCPADTLECPCYKTQNCPYPIGCLIEAIQCTGHNLCGDWSDQVNCTCLVGQFKCACVGTEEECNNVEENCINGSMLCDGKPDCFDGSDESHYTCNCSGVYARCSCDPSNKHCPSAGRCIPFHWVGNKVEDCSDGSDEACSVTNITCQSCTLLATTCKSEQLSRYLVHSTTPAICNTVIQPSCAYDSNSCQIEKVICLTPICENPPEFCQDVFICENQRLVPSKDFCDRKYDLLGCGDNSDEIREGFGFKCSGSSRQGVCVLPQANIYDSTAQCYDGSDLCFDKNSFRCFQCLDRKLIISPKQVCDGIVDCYDLSDECLCFNQSLCNTMRGSCPSNQMHCYNETDCVKQKGVLCNAATPCVDKINTKACLNESNNDIGVLIPGGKTIVERLTRIAVFRNLNIENLFFLFCKQSYATQTGFVKDPACLSMFYCLANSRMALRANKLCNGKPDCDDASDEFLERCYNSSYYCKNKDRFSINQKHVCDGIIDCENESDESRCRCQKERFYCTNKQPLSVDWKLVQNGISDCLDGSDECVNLASDALADANEMIANPFYRALFWITSLLALGGNLLVILVTFKRLCKLKRDQNVFINTSVFILNLCLSDFLMGVYLLTVIVQGTRFSGSYCAFDKEWRSSTLCSALGALAVASSQASAFTMTAMTTFRMLSVFKPFTTRNMGLGTVALTELLCWIAAIILAVIPLLQVTSEYFTTDVWFPNNLFKTDVVSRENMTFLVEKITMTKPKSWNDVKSTVAEAFPRNSIKGEFGYYGETSVCMPRLFATTNEFAWEYSTFLITVNFLMFIYMVVAYVLIYKQSNRMKGSRSTDVSSKMQKRISRLILTDFCCWIPVCVMGYLSVGGYKMSPDAYVLSACLLLPINSALNPLIYSKTIEQCLFKVKSSWMVRKVTALPSLFNFSTVFTVRYNVDAEEGRVVEIVE